MFKNHTHHVKVVKKVIKYLYLKISFSWSSGVGCRVYDTPYTMAIKNSYKCIIHPIYIYTSII